MAEISGATVYRQAFLEALRPPPDMLVSDWADEHRVLSGKGSAEKGPWRTRRAPYLKEPMDCLSPQSPYRRVVMVFGSQLGKTEVGLNWLGAIIHLWPGPALLVQPSLEMAKRLNRQRLEPMLRETPVVSEKMAVARSRDSSSTMFLKEFSGGLFVLATAESGSSLQSMPAAYLWADECSSFPIEVDDKGDPLANAERRTSNFPMGKILLTSTPGTKGACRISTEFDTRSDQRRYHALMPCCGAREVIRWQEHMKWDRPDGEVFCQCPSCGERIEQYHKDTMLAGGEWRPTVTGDGVTAGFHLPGWYAPIGWTPWEEIRDEFLRAKNDKTLLQNWVQTRAAEAWEDEALARVNAEGLMGRAARDPYPTGFCPDGVLVLLMAVDVQDTWLEVSIWGYGTGEQAWLVWHQKIEGDPSINPEGDPNRGGPWLQVDAIRSTSFPTAAGGVMRPRFCGVDTGGHFTHEAYEFCRRRAKEGVVAVKGSNSRDSVALSRGTKQDVNYRGQVIPRGVTLFMVGGHNLKRTFYARLRNDAPGPGFVNFGQNATEEYLNGLTIERLQPRYVKGFQVLEWHCPSGGRNEPLDCAIYCLALLELVKRRYSRATMWEQLSKEVEVATLPAQDASSTGEPIKRKRSSWLSKD